MGSGERVRQLPLGAVLVVDDSSSMREIIAHQLGVIGCTVTQAAEGIEALYRARHTAFDLVVTDVHMPAMGGLELLEELRKLPSYTTTPVFMLTSDYSEERVQQARRLGVTVWLKKPVNLDVLVFHARHVLDAQRLQRATS
jgi:two-component system chemotaxis response regulator CheY